MNIIIRVETGQCYAPKKKKNSMDKGHLECTKEAFSHTNAEIELGLIFEGGKGMSHVDMQISGERVLEKEERANANSLCWDQEHRRAVVNTSK